MMRVSTKIDYGVKAMVRLALAYDEGAIPLNRVAEEERVSLAYLQQLMIPLKIGGLVRSVRGAKGGYRLAQSPSEITAGDVVEALEGPFVPIFCVDPAEGERELSCVFELSCSTRHLWERVREQVNATLFAVTLEELARREGRFQVILPRKEVLAGSLVSSQAIGATEAMGVPAG